MGRRDRTAKIGLFTETIRLPGIIELSVIVEEFFGSLGLIAGLATRFAAMICMVIMLGAITNAHWQNGFFMNWFGKQQGEGYEYHPLMIGIGFALLVTGVGTWSVDKVLAERVRA